MHAASESLKSIAGPVASGAAWWVGAPIGVTLVLLGAWLLGHWAPTSLARWRLATSPRYAALVGLDLVADASAPGPDAAEDAATQVEDAA